MPRVCTICSHDDRLEIDREIVKGKAILKIAKDFDVDYQALYNHSRKHLSRQMLRSVESKEMLSGERLSAELEEIVARAKDIFDRAELDGKPGMSIQALREWRGCLETIAKIAEIVQSGKKGLGGQMKVQWHPWDEDL